MISFREDNGRDDSPSHDLQKKFQKLLNIIHEQPKYYDGSYHKNVDIAEIIQVIYDNLYNHPENKSIYLIIDKNPNNSLDLTIDKIE